MKTCQGGAAHNVPWETASTRIIPNRPLCLTDKQEGQIMPVMNKLPSNKRAAILGMMVEGVSIRAIARLTGASKNTVVKFLREAGEACLRYQDQQLRGLTCKRIQVDEIWSFVG